MTGYTDTSGAAQYNMKLSLRRAQSVKAYLVSKSIPADRIDVEGKGQADPLATKKLAKAVLKNADLKVLPLSISSTHPQTKCPNQIDSYCSFYMPNLHEPPPTCFSIS